MKKRIIFLGAVLVLLTGCSGTQAEKKAEDSIPTIETITTESVTARTTETDTAAAPALDAAAAAELIRALDTVDRLGASAVNVDENIKYTDDNGEVYFKTDNPDFKSTGDIQALMDRCMTEKFISQRYSFMLGSDSPMFIDADGGLYIKYAPRGGGFAFTDKEPTVQKISDDKYLVLAKYDDCGAPNVLQIEVVRDASGYKIDNIAF